MTNDFASPAEHAHGWRLISGDAHTRQGWINASDTEPPLLLVLDTQGDWWAVAPNCRRCSASLTNPLRNSTAHEGCDELLCTQCGAAHGPGVADCDCVALMVVDEEIYAAPDLDS